MSITKETAPLNLDPSTLPAGVDFDHPKYGFPSPFEIAETYREAKSVGEARKELRKLCREGFENLTEGMDLSYHVSTGEHLKKTSIRPTASSFRDYTHPMVYFLIAAGLTTRADWINALKDPEVFGTDVGGLHDNAVHALMGIPTEHSTLLKLTVVTSSDAASYVRRFITEFYNQKKALGSSKPVEILNVLDIMQIMTFVHESDPSVKVAEMSERIEQVVNASPDFLFDSGDLLKAKIGMEAAEMTEGWPDTPIEYNLYIKEVLRAVLAFKESAVAHEKATPTVVERPAPAKRYEVPSTLATAIDSVMGVAKLPGIESLIDELHAADMKSFELEKQVELMAAKARPAPAKIAATTELPDGETDWSNALTVLQGAGIKVPTAKKGLFDFDVPHFIWDSAHRDVPDIDPDYKWRWDILAKVMWGLANNKKPWIWGHTGTGKTTLVEQVCAILQWPFMRINFDSEITRMDLVGRDTLKTDEHGNTASIFVDGILPQAMSGPYVICNDELDFVRSDIAYVYQRSLEDKGLLLTEDGGRLVQPHPYSRMVATANTQGQGDEFGLYQGARVQSQAFLDRFQCWVEVPYLSTRDEFSLVQAKVPELAKDMIEKVVKYTKEHRVAFKQAEILKPISPRGVVSLSEAISFFVKLDKQNGVRMALESTVLGSATHADAAKINELIDRTFN